MRYTKTMLQKVEAIFEDIDYVIRYEKGNFNAGYCIVDNRKIAIVNKFFDTEARINTLIEILNTISVEEEKLSDASRKFFVQLLLKEEE